MFHFNLGNLADWMPVAFGELLEFDVPENGYRAVQFEVMCDRYVAVRVVTGDQSRLVGYGDGLVSVRFAMDEPFAVLLDAPGDGEAYVRSGREAQVIPQSEHPSYTTITPRSAGPSDELRRMMLIVKMNADRREAKLKAEMDHLRSLIPPTPAEPAPAPAAAPAAAPAPVSEPAQ